MGCELFFDTFWTAYVPDLANRWQQSGAYTLNNCIIYSHCSKNWAVLRPNGLSTLKYRQSRNVVERSRFVNSSSVSIVWLNVSSEIARLVYLYVAIVECRGELETMMWIKLNIADRVRFTIKRQAHFLLPDVLQQ